MKLIKLSLALLLSTATFSYANTPSDASINKLAEIVPYELLFQEVVFSPYEMELQSLAYAVQNDQKLTAKQREDAIQAYKTYADNLIKELSTPAKKAELKKAYITSAKQNYTQEEVDALLVFYSNKVLQSALDKGDKVAEGYIKGIEKSTTDAITKYDKTHRTKTEDAIKRITNK